MTRVIEYDNDKKGRFFVVDYLDGKENGRVMLRDVHDFDRLLSYIEQNSYSYHGYVLKPTPGLATKLLEEHERGKKLEYTDRVTAMDLGLVDNGKWKNKMRR